MKKQGFTLVETIVVIFIFTLLAVGVTTLFTHIFISSNDRLNAIDNIDQSSLVATNFINQIRIASVGNDGSYPIQKADDAEIIFYSNYGQADGVVTKVRYYLATSTLYKEIDGKTSAVQNNIVNNDGRIFYYYDGDYMGSSTPLTQPVSISQIKYVKINFDVLKQDVRNATTTFNVSAGASIRNLKTNLGN
jgi:prepilin-type N-terminal cleavage/methylation domain-containing protein